MAAMNEANAARCAALREKGVVPTLAVVRVGERPDDLSYEKGVMARCAKVGVEVKQFLLPADASQEELLRVIAGINADAAIHGCLLFRPLPKQFDDRTIRAALSPEKDIDGITDGSLAGVFTNTAVGYPPCTAQACLEILKFYNIPLSGKRAVVVGRSLVVGKPAAMMLDRENATVTLCNSRTQNLPEVCREADVVVVAMGRMGFIGAEHLRAGQVVVDVGIHVNEEGRLCGDVRFGEAEPVVEAITPRSNSLVLCFLLPVTIRSCRQLQTGSSSSCRTEHSSIKFQLMMSILKMMRWQENVRYIICLLTMRTITKKNSTDQNKIWQCCF